jgi:hypothetical protein
MNNRTRPFTRRFVNALLAIALAWPASGTVPSLMPKQADPQDPLQRLLMSIFRSRRSACAIGRACLNSLPKEEKAGCNIWNKIFADALCETEPIKSRETMRRRIANQVRRDFANGAIVDVDGWLLSVTEARVYALVALCSELGVSRQI